MALLMKDAPFTLASFFHKAAASAHPKAAAVAQSALGLACELQRLQSACGGGPSSLNAAPEKAQVDTSDTQKQYSRVIKSAFMEWMLGNLSNRTAFNKAHSVTVSAHLGRALIGKVKSTAFSARLVLPLPSSLSFLLFVLWLFASLAFFPTQDPTHGAPTCRKKCTNF
jgi:hypothetical protein